MRATIIILGLFGGLMLGEQAFVPLYVHIISGRSPISLAEATVVAIFAGWAVATALIPRAPALAVGLYSAAGVAGLGIGLTADHRTLIIWGVLACGLAPLALLARQELATTTWRETVRDRQLAALTAAVLGPPAAASERDAEPVRPAPVPAPGSGPARPAAARPGPILAHPVPAPTGDPTGGPRPAPTLVP